MIHKIWISSWIRIKITAVAHNNIQIIIPKARHNRHTPQRDTASNHLHSLCIGQIFKVAPDPDRYPHQDRFWPNRAPLYVHCTFSCQWTKKEPRTSALQTTIFSWHYISTPTFPYESSNGLTPHTNEVIFYSISTTKKSSRRMYGSWCSRCGLTTI